MSFSLDKRMQIKHYLLEQIEQGEKKYASKTSQCFETSKQTIYNYVKELLSEEVLEKNDKGRYVLKTTTKSFKFKMSDIMEKGEDIVYKEHIQDYTKKFSKNVQDIWEYAFTEMLNNAIDHSNAKNVQILVMQNYLRTTIFIIDDGIGIFKKIQTYYHYSSLDEAVEELFKGKLTTDSNNHSGEGIFFTSRILDIFAAISDNKIFTHNEYDDVFLDLSANATSDTGNQRTLIMMDLSNFSKKLLTDVMDSFANVDEGFTKTQIPLRRFFASDPVSRSQAKRLCRRLTSFEEVVFDFTDISQIGQGFAHELFIVFQNANPNVKLTPTNCNAEVCRMIKHVRSGM